MTGVTFTVLAVIMLLPDTFQAMVRTMPPMVVQDGALNVETAKRVSRFEVWVSPFTFPFFEIDAVLPFFSKPKQPQNSLEHPGIDPA